MASPRRLSAGQLEHFARHGYLNGLPPVYPPGRVHELHTGLLELLALLRSGESSKEIREWHETSRFLYDICMHPTILDFVDDLLGPDFYLWVELLH